MSLFNRLKCPYCEVYMDEDACCFSCVEKLKQNLNENTGHTPYCDAFTAPLIYSDFVKTSIHKFKFEGKREFAAAYVGLMKRCDIPAPDILIPVPEYTGKHSEKKDYSTSSLLCYYMSKELGIKKNFNAVKKIRKTNRQHKIEYKERFNNLRDCYEANPRKVRDKKILICDDIITSGNTINEIAKACKKAGALKVYAVAIAVSGGTFLVNFDLFE